MCNEGLLQFCQSSLGTFSDFSNYSAKLSYIMPMCACTNITKLRQVTLAIWVNLLKEGLALSSAACVTSYFTLRFCSAFKADWYVTLQNMFWQECTRICGNQEAKRRLRFYVSACSLTCVRIALSNRRAIVLKCRGDQFVKRVLRCLSYFGWLRVLRLPIIVYVKAVHVRTVLIKSQFWYAL